MSVNAERIDAVFLFCSPPASTDSHRFESDESSRTATMIAQQWVRPPPVRPPSVTWNSTG